MVTRLVVLLVLLAFGSAYELKAYADPGSGALIWQILVAGFVGSMFYVRRITSWFRRKKTER